jgi:hypothetical protein
LQLFSSADFAAVAFGGLVEIDAALSGGMLQSLLPLDIDEVAEVYSV